MRQPPRRRDLPDHGHRGLLIGYFRRGNLGDDAMLAGFTTFLAEAAPQARVHEMSLPRRGLNDWRAMRRLIGALRHSDSVTLVGGTHFHDAYGFRSIPILASHLALVTAARVAGCTVGLAGMGIGPLDRVSARILTRLVFQLAAAKSVRDEPSLRVAYETGLGDGMVVGFDLAALMDVPATRAPVPAGHRIAVSLVPYFGVYHDQPRLDEQVVHRIAQELIGLDIPNLTVEVVNLNRDAERRLSSLLAKELRDNGISAADHLPDDVAECLRLLEGCDAVIATRYHAALLGFLMEKPLVMIAYEDKCRSLAEQIGLSSLGVVTPENVIGDDTRFGRAVVTLVTDPATLRSRLSRTEARDAARSATRDFLRLLGVA